MFFNLRPGAVVSEDGVAVFLFIMTLFSLYSSAKWYQMIPKMFYPLRLKKEKEISTLERESASLNTPSTFHLYAKSQRKANTLKAELRDITTTYRNRGILYNYAPYVVYLFLRYGYIFPAWGLFSSRTPELVPVPDFFVLNPIGVFNVIGLAGPDSNTGPWIRLVVALVHVRFISVVVWCLVCQVGVRYAVRCVYPRSII